MNQYLELLREVRNTGVQKGDRTGTGTLSLFGKQIRFDLSKGFPAVTTKKLYWKGVVGELLWFLKGSTNVKWLQENGISIWDEWAKENGELGPVYGVQWRSWPVYKDLGGGVTLQEDIDQLAKIIDEIKAKPDSRRLLVSAWNVADLPKMALEPCHVIFQFYVTPEHLCRGCDGKGHCTCPIDGTESYACPVCEGSGKIKAKLSLQLYQRSADLFLGVPFNIASYALLTHMVAQVCNLEVGEFIHTFGDAHIYLNHLEQVDLQLTREPMELPKLWLNPAIKDIDSFGFEDIKLEDYVSHPGIKAPVAV